MKYFIGFFTGAIFGAAVALLYAPKSGEELRADIRTEADARYQQMQQQFQHSMTEIQARIDKINTDLKTTTDRLKAAQSAAMEELSSKDGSD
jgi:gas vesicle protein